MIKNIAHIGIAVKNMDDAVKAYKALGLKLEKVESVPEQGVKTGFLPVGGGYVEFLEALNAESGIAKFIEKRGEGIHHICLEVDNLEKELQSLSANGVELIDKQPRKGVEGKIAFVHPKSTKGVLIELVEKHK
ncbi:MAG: methylmalonyl-CoA epimerase [Dehalococcoidia bacterium]|nr:methylmalonyl-CoA epimerase [Dehalococcoidia bacterium]